MSIALGMVESETVYVKTPGGELVKCPKCGSTDVRYSDGIAIWDLVMWLRRKHAVRCRNCRLRFYARTDESKSFIWTTRD
jgi:DNA-directed RNA polymerase subunit RPC12/RpoP